MHRAVRFWARAHAVRVRDEHEATLLRQRELRQSLPWRAAPFTTSTLAAEEAVPPLLQLPSKHDDHSHTSHRRQHHPDYRRQQEDDEEEAAVAISGAVDPSASIQIQELQKLLVDVLKEVAGATDPTQRRIAESMLSQVRATILAQKSAEWADELDGDSEWEEHVAAAAAREKEGGEEETADEEAQEAETVAETDRRQHYRDTERRERYQDSRATHTMADSHGGELMDARAGAMDSWLTEQHHQAHIHSSQLQSRSPAQLHLRQVKERQPVVKSTSRAQRHHRQHPESPSNDEIREQLAVRTRAACPHRVAR